VVAPFIAIKLIDVVIAGWIGVRGINRRGAESREQKRKGDEKG